MIGVPEPLEVLLSVPHAPPLQPLKDHVTPAPLGSLETFAVIGIVTPTGTVGVLGETATETGGVTVIVAIPVLDVSATDTAVSVTVDGLGTEDGAEYVTGVPEALELALSVPQLAPLHPVPESAHVTPLFWGSLLTVAVNA